MPGFPELPIVSPDQPRKSQTEKYGGLLYLSLTGIAVLVALIFWFGAGVWSLRTVLTAIYVLNDPTRSEERRLDAASRLASDPIVTPRQKWDLALSRVPPDLARYLLAESLDSELVNENPRVYAITVARSEGWPDWLRLLLIRTLAVAASEGTRLDLATIRELSQNRDPVIRLFCDYILAVGTSAEDPLRVQNLEHLTEAAKGESGPLADSLLAALENEQPKRAEHLRQATKLIRTLHPRSREVWQGWSQSADGRVSRSPQGQTP